MGKRLPPGEAERRAAERKRRLWGGETTHTYNPEKEGFGNSQEWRGNAEAFARGDTVVNTVSKSKVDPDMELLGLSEMPDRPGLSRCYRKEAAKLFRAYGSDTAPGYSEAFGKLTEAYNRLAAKYTRG